jgi:hypothetical protein
MKVAKKLKVSRKVRWILVGVVIGSLVAICTVVITLTRTGSDARVAIANNRQAVIESTTTLNTKLADNSLVNSDKILLLNSYSTDIASRLEAICGPQRGQLFIYLLPERDKCNRARETLQKLEGTATSIYMFMKQQEALAKAIPSSEGLSFQQSYDIWNGAIGVINEIEVIPQLSSTKEAIISAVSSYRDAWKALIDADSNKDETSFESAHALLVSAHKTLTEASSGLNEPLDGFTREFNVNIEAFMAQTDPAKP